MVFWKNTQKPERQIEHMFFTTTVEFVSGKFPSTQLKELNFILGFLKTKTLKFCLISLPACFLVPSNKIARREGVHVDLEPV